VASRVWRTAVVVAACATAAACTAAPKATDKASPSASVSASPTSLVRTVESPVSGGCGQTPLVVGGLPDWTQRAAPPERTPYAISHEGNAIAVLFGYPLRAGKNVQNPSNKILWVMRDSRDEQQLQLTMRPSGRAAPTVTLTRAADSGPGEIYPSGVDVPTAGCWTVQAEWNGHHATLELSYR
jgi:hypothetical protein